MENDLVKDIKDACKKLDKILYDKYDEFVERGICDLADKKDADTVGIGYLEDVADFIESEQLIYRTVNKSNSETKKMKFNLLVKAVDSKFEEIEEHLKAKEEVMDVTRTPEVDDEETEDVENVHKCRRGLFFVLGGVTVAAAVFLAGQIQSCNTKNAKTAIIDTTEEEETKENSKETETSKETEKPTETTTEETTPSQTEEVKVVVPGEFGTFTDINDDQQIADRAQYIIDNYYGPFYDQLSAEEQAAITPQNIINVIRANGGRAPLDNEGNVTISANTADDVGQSFTYLAGDLGSSPQLQGIYHNVPAYMFFVDNSKEQEFVKSYDEAYQKITDGFNLAVQERLEGKEVTGGTLVREGIAEVGTKMWNEWHLQGMYGDVNPYNFDAKSKMPVYLATMARYGQYAFEYNMNAMQPVCIPVCIDYSTKEMQEVNVNEIYWGIATGEWNNIIGKSVGAENKVGPDSIAFLQDWQEQLEWSYNQEKSNTLKLN